MKIKKILIIGLAGLLGVTSIICIASQNKTFNQNKLFGNQYLIDTVYHFDYAIIKLDGTTLVEGKVEKWTDYEQSDQIQVQIDGNTYLVHSSNIVLMKEGK